MQDEFDNLFDAAFAEAAKKQTLAPSSDPLWEKTQRALRKRRTRRNRLRSLPLIAFSFLLGALLFGTPMASDAFSPFFQEVKSLPDGVVKVIFGSSSGMEIDAKTAPPPEFEAPLVNSDGIPEGMEVPNSRPRSENFSGWEEIRTLYDGIAPDNSTIPEGYKLLRVEAKFDSKSGALLMATGIYQSDAGSLFTIMTFKREKNEVFNSEYKETDGTLEKLKIHGYEAFLFITLDGTSSLEWVTGSWRIAIVGQLQRDELIEIGKGIQ